MYTCSTSSVGAGIKNKPIIMRINHSDKRHIVYRLYYILIYYPDFARQIINQSIVICYFYPPVRRVSNSIITFPLRERTRDALYLKTVCKCSAKSRRPMKCNKAQRLFPRSFLSTTAFKDLCTVNRSNVYKSQDFVVTYGSNGVLIIFFFSIRGIL